MSILVTVLLVLLGVLLAVVVLPFHVRGRAAVHDSSPTAAVRLHWAWGFLGFELSTSGAFLRVAGLRVWRFRKRSKRDREEKAEKGEEEESDEKPKKPVLARLKAQWRHRQVLMRILARVARPLRLRLRISGVVGTGDPADTAMLLGALRLLAELPGVEVDVGCDWLDEELEIDVEGSARVWLLHLLGVAAAVLVVRENRVALRAVN